MNAWGDKEGKMHLCTFVLIHENNVFPSSDVNEILQTIESTEEQKGDHMMETLGLHCIVEHTQQSSSFDDLHYFATEMVHILYKWAAEIIMIVSQYYLPRQRKQQKRVFVPVAMILHNITVLWK